MSEIHYVIQSPHELVTTFVGFVTVCQNWFVIFGQAWLHFVRLDYIVPGLFTLYQVCLHCVSFGYSVRLGYGVSLGFIVSCLVTVSHVWFDCVKSFSFE